MLSYMEEGGRIPGSGDVVYVFIAIQVTWNSVKRAIKADWIWVI